MTSIRLASLTRVALLFLVCALFTGSAAPALASVCGLADHIKSANTNTAVGFCPAGTSHDIITITEDITLSAALPPITGTITIEGGGHTISGDRKFGIFEANGGRLTINNLTMADGYSDETGGGCDIGAIESTTALPERTPLVPPPPCPLAQQITAANTNAPAGGCPAGSGHDVIILTEDIDLDAPLPPITSEITVEGNGYTISGSRKFRIFDVDDGQLTLSDLTLRDGNATHGGAIRLINGARVKASTVTFSANDALRGGAIETEGADVTLILNGSSFISNTSQNNAGALSVDGGAVSITNSSFSGNSAKFKCGAIDGSAGRIVILNSTISGNKAETGAGIYLNGADATLTHLTVVDNRAHFVTGGGIYKEAELFICATASYSAI